MTSNFKVILRISMICFRAISDDVLTRIGYMPYLAVSPESLKKIAQSVMNPELDNSDPNNRKNLSFGKLLLQLTDENIDAARGFLIFGLYDRIRDLDGALYAVCGISYPIHRFQGKQALIDLMAFYDYLPKFNPSTIPNFCWDKQEMINRT